MFYKTGVFKKFAIFAEKNLCWSLFLINLVKKRLQYRYFPVSIAKFLRKAFYRTPDVAALQVLYKKDVLKNFTNFTTMYRYRSPFLSNWKPITCNFVKIESPVEVFCCEFCEISRDKFMQNNFEPLLLDVKRCCRKWIVQKLKIHQKKKNYSKEITKWVLWKRFWCLMNYILQIIWSIN